MKGNFAQRIDQQGTETVRQDAPALQISGWFAAVLLPALTIIYLAARGRAGFGKLEATMFVASYLLTGFGITGGFHRLVTHRAYALPRRTRWIVIALGSMAIQGSIFTWVASHRRHHRYSDRASDPHTPVYDQPRGFFGTLRGFMHAQVGWYFDGDVSDQNEYIPDLLDDPQLVRLARLFPWFAILSGVIPAAIGFLVRGTAIAALDGFFWGGVIRVIFGHQTTGLVNSVCHLFGARPYSTRDNSRNNFVVALLTLGEGWHNNHHAFPTSAYHGLRWW